ncbi:hypothetical protein Ftrac_2024 [Marivirga tractuosa DSM 4126]|uniref:Uncharacterized protein n=1 Tax=Marivirga tractuosa (strain ATCC 23168 / DSM 4126 / NBRC 15989 / NCIMB 1408 / VKM B-1430 / H-43) TaxID=643867 RepID=E4TTV4_MARTH|nr:hypothetical protein Ftrac_2024 [Marivirga tractuosa DSM 4126]
MLPTDERKSKVAKYGYLTLKKMLTWLSNITIN